MTSGAGSGGTASGGIGVTASGGNGATTGSASGGASGSGGGGGQVSSAGGHPGTGGGQVNGSGGQGAATAGSGGTTGTGAATGNGGQGTGGMVGAAPSCLDGKMNGTETGVDCGGTCPACPNYKINPPNLKNNAQSGCANGGQAFMCTRSMAFSPEFKQAAMDDWSSGDPPFVYGVVGHDKDQGALDTESGNTCCQCYQLVFESPKDPVTGLPTPKPMIVQAFNTAAGGAKNFDIFMAKGGEGANTVGCSQQYSQFPSVGETNNGGIRALNFSQQCATMNQFTAASISAQMCQDQINAQCMMLQSSAASVQSASQGSCIETNQPGNLYHLNWNVRAKRIECPANLTRVTGCKLNSQGLPQADPTAKDAASASSGYMTGYSTTTMQDCCRPTCAYVGNNNVAPGTADSSYGSFYSCDKSGNPM
jgi:hypothetical protein